MDSTIAIHSWKSMKLKKATPPPHTIQSQQKMEFIKSENRINEQLKWKMCPPSLLLIHLLLIINIHFGEKKL